MRDHDYLRRIRVWIFRRLVDAAFLFHREAFPELDRRTADLLGTVFVYTDYNVPVDAIRRELHDILERLRLWDRTCLGLEVTNATDRTIRDTCLDECLLTGEGVGSSLPRSRKSSSTLQKNYPLSLPRVRADINPSPNGIISASR